MKKLLLLLAANVLASISGAQTLTTNNFALNPTTAIPDGNLVGLTETFTVSGLTGSITNVQFSLDVSGGFNGDLYVYLAGPAGQMAVLLNRAGVTTGNPAGYGDGGLHITFDDAAANGNIHYYQPVQNPGGGQLLGTWAPDGRNIDPQSIPSAFDSAITDANLSLFNGSDGNGVWTFFIADLAGGNGTATLNQAILTITTVPEPQTLALAVGGGLLLLLASRKWR